MMRDADDDLISEMLLIDVIGIGDILTRKQMATHHVSMSSGLRIVHSNVAKARARC